MKTTIFAAVVCAAAGTASAQTLLSNLPGTSSDTGTNLGLGTDLADRTKAVGITMGAESLQFASMTALISNPGTTPATLSGGIFTSAAGAPGAQLAAFNSVNVGAGAGASEVTLTTAASFTLQANTSYWFVLDGPSSSNDLLWESLVPNTAPTPAAGITFDGYSFSADGGASWGQSGIFNGVRITAVPAPSALAAFAGAGLIATRRRR